jgi:hypothetical protein
MNHINREISAKLKRSVTRTIIVEDNTLFQGCPNMGDLPDFAISIF